MTVADLIKKLQEFPLDAIVRIDTEDGAAEVGDAYQWDSPLDGPTVNLMPS